MDKKPISALLLAAGYGTRLRPLTIDNPKCLIYVNDKPILEEWIIKLEEINAQKVLVNTHYFSEQIEDFLTNYQSDSMKITTSYEKKLLGTAGTLMDNLGFIFIIIFTVSMQIWPIDNE